MSALRGVDCSFSVRVVVVVVFFAWPSYVCSDLVAVIPILAIGPEKRALSSSD